jgi:hypothetical protein
MTIAMPEPLKEELDRYHSRLYEPVDAATLIPHMIDAFIRSDRGYRSRRTQARREQIRQHGGDSAAATNGAARLDADGST